MGRAWLRLSERVLEQFLIKRALTLRAFSLPGLRVAEIDKVY